MDLDWTGFVQLNPFHTLVSILGKNNRGISARWHTPFELKLPRRYAMFIRVVNFVRLKNTLSIHIL